MVCEAEIIEVEVEVEAIVVVVVVVTVEVRRWVMRLPTSNPVTCQGPPCSTSSSPLPVMSSLQAGFWAWNLPSLCCCCCLCSRCPIVIISALGFSSQIFPLAPLVPSYPAYFLV